MISSIAPFCYIGLTLAIAVYLRNKRRHNEPQRLPLPPGPKKQPIVGNLLQLPTTYEWETYAQWSKEYGSDILHISAAGKSIVIANSLKVATDLFEKRSSKYSDRMISPMIHDLIGLDWLFGIMPYADAWRERRRLFVKHFHPANTESHQPKELQYTHVLLKQLLTTPENVDGHIKNLVGAITLSVAYGLDIKPRDDPYLEIAEKALEGLTASSVPGAFLVEVLPFLKYVPSWLPGASFKRRAAAWRISATKLVEVPFQDTLKAISAGTAPPSFVSTCMNELNESGDVSAKVGVIRDTAGAFLAGGADTTAAALNAFVLIMANHPEVQAKAQQELDRVIGENALPSFKDESSLPYIAAIVKEVQRFHAVTPLAFPHCLTEDDEYNGYFIPKNSIVVANSWAILHDENDYPEPMKFRPERFLTSDGTKLDLNVRSPSVAFGYGRRVCPGQHMASSLMFIAMASILAAFDISKATNQKGDVIEPRMQFTSSIISHPKPFQCMIKPRSAETRKMIMAL